MDGVLCSVLSSTVIISTGEEGVGCFAVIFFGLRAHTLLFHIFPCFRLMLENCDTPWRSFH